MWVHRGSLSVPMRFFAKLTEKNLTSFENSNQAAKFHWIRSNSEQSTHQLHWVIRLWILQKMKRKVNNANDGNNNRLLLHNWHWQKHFVGKAVQCVGFSICEISLDLVIWSSSSKWLVRKSVLNWFRRCFRLLTKFPSENLRLMKILK